MQATKGWVERTPANFEFSLKLYQKFTHPEMFHRATGQDPSALDTSDVDGFRLAIDPIANAGKLGALLAQFPPSFKNDANARGYLEWLVEAFTGYPLAIELRHRSFSDDPEGTLRLLSELGAALVQIDEPKFRLSIRQTLLPNVTTFYYMRLHGRNAAQWWKHDNPRTATTTSTRQASWNRSWMRRRKPHITSRKRTSTRTITSPRNRSPTPRRSRTSWTAPPGEYPEAFVDRYPDLKGIVRILPPRPSDTLV